MTDQTSCSLCGSNNVLLIGEHQEFSGHQIGACTTCGMIATFPLPNQEALSQYYQDQYRPHENEITWYYKLTQHLRAKAQVRYCLSQLGNNFFRGKKVLDMGCSIGALLRQLKKRGAEAVGIDQRQTMVDYAKKKWGLDVRRGNLDVVASESASFDLIVLSHVLEHLRNPKEFLSSVMSLLKKNGYLFVEIPNHNVEKVENQIFNRHRTDSHLFFFSQSDVKNLLKKINWNILDIRTVGKQIETKKRKQAADKHPAALKESSRQKLVGRLPSFLLSPARKCKEFIFLTKVYLNHPYENYFSSDGGKEGNWIRILCQKGSS